MNEDRRGNYRAASADERAGWLVFGRRAYHGTIADESSGGFCFITPEKFDVEGGDDGTLAASDGLSATVRVAYIDSSSGSTRVGLHRTEMIREEVTPRRKRTPFRFPRLTIIAIGVLAGLALGLLVVRHTWAI
jgi:hypothetical protein